MVDNPDKIEVEIGESGGKVAVSGDGTSRLVNALADFISPASQSMGVVGDAIQQFRVHRSQMAAIALERAKEIKRGRGEAVRPISRKLLAPWIEGASSEDPDGNNITELWARILAASPEHFDSKVATFIDIATRIGPEEDRLLRSLADSADLSQGFFQHFTFSAKNEEKITQYLADSAESSGDQTAPDFASRLARELDARRPSLWVGLVMFVTIQQSPAGIFRSLLTDEVKEAADVLVREGIFERRESQLVRFSKRTSVRVDYVQATDLGIGLLRSVYPKKDSK